MCIYLQQLTVLVQERHDPLTAFSLNDNDTADELVICSSCSSFLLI